MNILQWLIVYHSKINLSLRTCQQWKDLFEQLWGKRTRRVFTKIVHTSECLVMYFCLLNSYSTAELNQRALVGKSAAVLPGIADETAEDAINATRRYLFTLLGDQISRKLLDIFHSALEILLCDYVHVFFLQICWIRQWTWGKAK